MKKISTLLAFVLASAGLKAQLYYTFTAVSSTYTTLAGATTATLLPTSSGTGYIAFDEGYANNIPLGFTLQYDGINYTKLHANSNGFITLGEPFFTDATNYDRQFYKNSLTTGTPRFPVSKPIIAPLWDDLGIVPTGSLSYKTEGTAPNRIFTLQWDKVQWTNLGTTTPSISFQLKLYETTNVVEFVYNRETGSITAPTASIGISSDANGSGSFISLQNTSTAPTISTTTETTTLNAKPATGQVYRFTPDACTPPNGLRTSGYNNTSVTYKWNAVAGSTGYQVAVDNSATPPATGTSVGTNTFATQTALMPATTYYLHVKNSCGTAWRNLAFKTAETPAATPFTDGFETATGVDLPTTWRTENFNNTTDGAFWSSFSDPTYAASGNRFITAYTSWVDADEWAYTPSISLVAGTQYKLRFKYAIAGGGVHTLRVRTGNKVGKDSMPALLFSNANIINDLDNGDAYKDTTILFTASNTGIFYFGFNYATTIANSQAATFFLDDVSVLPNAITPVTLLYFTGNQKNNQHILNWQTTTEQNNSGFDIEQSLNGTSFTSLGFVASKAMQGISSSVLTYTFTNAKIAKGSNYYRLKQIDKDGKFVYSNVVNLQNYNGGSYTLAVYPNPVKDIANVFIDVATNQNANMVLYSIDGKMCWQQNSTLQVGQQIISIPTKAMAKGYYKLIVISNGNEKQTVSIIKE